MNRLSRCFAAAAVPLVLAVGLTGCGGSDNGGAGGSSGADASIPAAPVATPDPSTDAATDPPVHLPGAGAGAASDAPADASDQDFCDALNAGPDELGDDDEQAAAEIHAYGESLAEVGTPVEVSGDARAGFEVLVDFFATIDAAQVDEFSSQGTPEDVLGATNGALATTFFTQAVQVCQQTLTTDGSTPTEGAS